MPKLGQTLKRLNMILILLVHIMCLSNLLMANHNMVKISNLLQFHFEEFFFVQVESKLISSKLNCQACEKNLISYESAYTKILQD